MREQRVVEGGAKEGSYNYYLRGHAGHFGQMLAEALAKADGKHHDMMRKAFPQIVAAHEMPNYNEAPTGFTDWTYDAQPVDERGELEDTLSNRLGGAFDALYCFLDMISAYREMSEGLVDVIGGLGDIRDARWGDQDDDTLDAWIAQVEQAQEKIIEFKLRFIERRNAGVL